MREQILDLASISARILQKATTTPYRNVAAAAIHPACEI